MFKLSFLSILICSSISLTTTGWSQTPKGLLYTFKGLKGKTGFRGGFVFDNSQNKLMGNDFYIFQFKAVKNCLVVVETLDIYEGGKTLRLSPTFLDTKKDMNVIAGETISIRAEKNDSAIELLTDSNLLADTLQGKLVLKVNGTPIVLTVKKFENLFTN